MANNQPAQHREFLLQDESDRPSGHFLDKQLIEARTLMISGAVTDKMARDVTARLLVIEQLDPSAMVTVFINSPGGSADSGFAIYDILRFVANPIRTLVNGLCASAGILIHLAGDKGKRYALPESRFMIHQPSTAGQGTASDLDITAREVIKLRERYARIIADSSGRDEKTVIKDAHRDFWLNSQEALDYGIVDQILNTRADLPS